MMTNKRDIFLWVLIAMMFFVSAFIYDIYTFELSQPSRIFGVSYMTMNNNFYSVIHNELIKEVEGKEDRLVLRDPMLDALKQQEQIREFIDMDVDGIFINPVDSNALSPVLNEAAASGIPVVVIDSPVNFTHGLVTSVYSDNYRAGQLCAQDLMEKYDGGKIALLLHDSVSSGFDRIEGFKNEIARDSRFEIVNEKECHGQTEQAMPAVLEILEETGDVDFIMCLNDPSALGAIAGLEFLGREDIRVYGVDGSPEFKKLLTQDGVAQGTVMQSPYQMAEIAVEKMYGFLNGDPAEETTLIDVEFLDRSNIGQQDLRSWQ